MGGWWGGGGGGVRTGCIWGAGGWEGGRGQGQVPRIDPLDFKPGCCLHRVHTLGHCHCQHSFIGWWWGTGEQGGWV